MSVLKWTFMFSLISRFIALRNREKSGEEPRIQVLGGEVTRFLLTFIFLYIWNAFWFRLI
jgi:hypothetical protein